MWHSLINIFSDNLACERYSIIYTVMLSSCCSLINHLFRQFEYWSSLPSLSRLFAIQYIISVMVSPFLQTIIAFLHAHHSHCLSIFHFPWSRLSPLLRLVLLLMSRPSLAAGISTISCTSGLYSLYMAYGCGLEMFFPPWDLSASFYIILTSIIVN